MQVLNTYLAEISEQQPCQRADIEFWLRETTTESCAKLRATLPAHGSLGPLFYACGLIDKSQLQQGLGSHIQGGETLPFMLPCLIIDVLGSSDADSVD